MPKGRNDLHFSGKKSDYFTATLVTRNLVELFMTTEIGFPRIAGHGTILSLGKWFLKVGYPKITRFHSYGPCTSGKENEMLWEPLSILTVFLLHCIHAHLWNCTWRRGEQLRLANTVHTVSKAWNVVYDSIPRAQLVRLDIHKQKRKTQLISPWHLLAQRQQSSILQHSLHTPRTVLLMPCWTW